MPPNNPMVFIMQILRFSQFLNHPACRHGVAVADKSAIFIEPDIGNLPIPVNGFLEVHEIVENGRLVVFICENGEVYIFGTLFQAFDRHVHKKPLRTPALGKDQGDICGSLCDIRGKISVGDRLLSPVVTQCYAVNHGEPLKTTISKKPYTGQVGENRYLY